MIRKKNKVSPITAQIINIDYINKILLNHKEVIFLGEGAKKFKSKFEIENLLIYDEDLNSAKGMVPKLHLRNT